MPIKRTPHTHENAGGLTKNWPGGEAPAPAPPPNHVGTARGTAARACCACVPWVRQTTFIKMVICTKIVIFKDPTHFSRYHTRQTPRPAAGRGALRVWGVCRGAAVWGANFLFPRVFWGGAKYRPPYGPHRLSPSAPRCPTTTGTRGRGAWGLRNRFSSRNPKSIHKCRLLATPQNLSTFWAICLHFAPHIPIGDKRRR